MKIDTHTERDRKGAIEYIKFNAEEQKKVGLKRVGFYIESKRERERQNRAFFRLLLFLHLFLLAFEKK